MFRVCDLVTRGVLVFMRLVFVWIYAVALCIFRASVGLDLLLE